jgi:hypothetical protein
MKPSPSNQSGSNFIHKETEGLAIIEEAKASINNLLTCRHEPEIFGNVSKRLTRLPCRKQSDGRSLARNV